MGGLRRVAAQCGGLRVTAGGKTVTYDSSGNVMGHSKSQKLIGVWMDEELESLIVENAGDLGKSAYVRKAIVSALIADGVKGVTERMALAPSREGKGGRPPKWGPPRPKNQGGLPL